VGAGFAVVVVDVGSGFVGGVAAGCAPEAAEHALTARPENATPMTPHLASGRRAQAREKWEILMIPDGKWVPVTVASHLGGFRDWSLGKFGRDLVFLRFL